MKFIEMDDNNNVLDIVKGLKVAAGAGRAAAVPSGVISAQVNAAGTGADTTEDTLHTFTLPANSLSANGKAVRVKIWGTTGANTNTKTLTLYIGSKSWILASAVAANAKTWFFEAVIVRSAAGGQVVVINGDFNGARVQPVNDTGTVDETTDLVIKTTGTNGTSSANDLVENGFMVEMLN